MTSKAEKIKAQGTERYKAGDLPEAIELYREAAELEPTVAVYASNLSAAEFEDGRYADALESCERALSIIGYADSSTSPLRAKLLARRARALTLLSHDNPSHFHNAMASTSSEGNDLQRAALLRRWASWQEGHLVDTRLTSLPRYRQKLGKTLEYYVIGHDQANSIFRTQYAMGGDGPGGPPNRERFHVRVPRDGSAFDFSAFFCGIGDARHMYASLLDIGQDLASFGAGKPKGKSKNKPKPAADMNVHFTINDVHPTALARDLIALSALEELAREQSTSRRGHDLLTMLHYLFWGAVMPPLARRVMDELRDRVYAQLADAQAKDAALDLGWLYVEPGTGKAILGRLDWWRGPGKTALSFEQMAATLEATNVEKNLKGLVDDKDIDIMKGNRKKKKSAFFEQLRNNPAQRAKMAETAREQGISLDAYLEQMEKRYDDEEEWSELEKLPANLVAEQRSFKWLRVLVPPAELEEVFAGIRSGDTRRLTRPAGLEVAHRKIAQRWAINYTFLDEHWLSKRLPTVNPFDRCEQLIPMYARELVKPPENSSGCLYDMSARFFGLVAEGIRRLGSALRLELVCGEGYAVMDQIRRKTLVRNPSFPVRFDRIHTSNVRDFIGGYLADFTTVLPLLKDTDAAYMTGCCLVNSGVWEGGMMTKQYNLNMDSQFFTFAAVVQADAPAAYGVEVQCPASYPGDYHTYGRVQKPRKRLPRNHLASIATGVFIRTVLPTKFKSFAQAQLQVREVLNVHAFFRSLEVFKGLGYPMHALADIVESILENRLTYSARPHQTVPIPVADRALPAVALCTTPFLAEFEVAAALWEPRLCPFCSEAVPLLNDIRRYAVRIEREDVGIMKTMWPEMLMTLALAFGLPKDMDEPSLDPRKQLVGKQWRSSVELVSTFEYDPEEKLVSVLLTSARAEKFMKDGYEVGIVNTAFWRLQSRKVSCAQLREVGALDAQWDASAVPRASVGRPMTRAQEQQWQNDMTYGTLGGSMGLGGMMNMLNGMGAGPMPPGYDAEKVDKMSDAFADMLGQGAPPGGCPTQ